ncbi:MULTISPECIES: hypothetical protein [Nocardia]|uniref:Uncharacterized protein n=2 Tax=Nocardia TaxID=1817 RepID=A0A846YEB5_9NOCA|nr:MULTISPECIES: hypothetical protein [Nocardia]NKY57025.1 hypothetical protein [Nocardia flavorosea]
MDHWQHLILMGLCLMVTVLREFVGHRGHRCPARLAGSVLPVAGILLVWDAIAITAETNTTSAGR